MERCSTSREVAEEQVIDRTYPLSRRFALTMGEYSITPIG
jgi:hypothetical protein